MEAKAVMPVVVAVTRVRGVPEIVPAVAPPVTAKSDVAAAGFTEMTLPIWMTPLVRPVTVRTLPLLADPLYALVGSLRVAYVPVPSSMPPVTVMPHTGLAPAGTWVQIVAEHDE